MLVVIKIEKISIIENIRSHFNSVIKNKPTLWDFTITDVWCHWGYLPINVAAIVSICLCEAMILLSNFEHVD